MPDSGAIGNAVKLVGEAVLPGASNLVDGDIKVGLAHTAAGLAAAALIGPLALLLVKANSYSYSVSEKSLPTMVGEMLPSRQGSSEGA